MKRALCPAALLLLPFAALAEQNAVVDWGGDLVPLHSNLLLPPPVGTLPATNTWPLETGALPISPEFTSGPKFWGVFELRNDGNTLQNLAIARIFDGEARDYLEIAARASLGTNVLSGLIFFKPENTGHPALSLERGLSLSLTIEELYRGGGKRAVRFAVKNEGVWYLSKESATGATTFEMVDAAGASWGAWGSLEGAAPLPKTPVEFSTSGFDLKNIEAVGFYFMDEVSNGSSPRIRVSAFRVEAQTP